MTPCAILLSDSEEGDSVEVNQVHVDDRGSVHQQVKVVMGGVPAVGMVDTGADLTIIGGSLFKQIAAVGRLHKRDFKTADKTPRNYDRQSFQLDGRLDLDVTFQDRTMKTPVYVKMDAPELLLLSEGVCRQLEIVTYHPEVKASKKTGVAVGECSVPVVRVQLVKSVNLPGRPFQGVVVEIDGPGDQLTGSLLFEPDSRLAVEHGVEVVDSVVSMIEENGHVKVMLTSQLGFPH